MDVWSFLQQKLNGSIPVILLYVLHSRASSPGRQGFKMGVAGDGSFCGSIGGGIMEHKFVEMARAKLRDDSNAGGIHRQVHDKDSPGNQSGMICSGEQTIFLYRLQPADATALARLVSSLRENKNGALYLSPAGIQFSQEIPTRDFHYRATSETDFMLVEKTGFKNILHIIGGGHCALAFSRIMRSMDFYIHLYEQREELKTMQQNHFVHQKHLLHSYADLDALIPVGENVYVVIMTMGYRTDDTALRVLMNKNFRYIGVLGSKTKMEKMYAAYRKQNIAKELLKKIKAPVGIPIKSQTPEEIAISIAAEIIAEKNKGQ
jgi:xanthine dehydrogenase accessory factor